MEGEKGKGAQEEGGEKREIVLHLRFQNLRIRIDEAYVVSLEERTE